MQEKKQETNKLKEDPTKPCKQRSRMHVLTLGGPLIQSTHPGMLRASGRQSATLNKSITHVASLVSVYNTRVEMIVFLENTGGKWDQK